MITFCICSTKAVLLAAIKENIAQTIGCEYELLSVENTQNPKGICQVYNECGHQAKYPYLCFVHEDVAFRTKDWGQVLISLLKKEETGLVGVAGGTFKTKATGPAWWSPIKNALRLNLIQQRADGTKEQLYANPENETSSRVVTVDGVFMACRKEVWEKYPFDEKTVQGFHYYDMDFSLTVGSHYQVVVTYDILLEHFSEGKNDLVWAQQADIVTEKWRQLLPRHTVPVSPAELQEAERQTADFYLHLLFKLGGSKQLQRKYIWRRFLAFPLDKLNLYYLRKFLANVNAN